MDSFTVRPMQVEEVDVIRTWATAEGWNPGLHDGPCFFATDPAGFFVGKVDGQLVSCISCVAYDESFGFLGQYIVQPGFRGLGYGLATWKAGMDHLGARNIGLDGVLEQQSNYERAGFRFAHHHIRYQGRGNEACPAGLAPLHLVSFEDILAYDQRCFPAPRPTFLKGWLAMPQSTALGFIQEGCLRGYGVIRRSIDGYKIGPLFADNLGVAELLLRGLIAETAGALFCLDIPEECENPSASQLVKQFGMTESFRTARMYTRGRPNIDITRVFGITTMELG